MLRVIMYKSRSSDPRRNCLLKFSLIETSVQRTWLTDEDGRGKNKSAREQTPSRDKASKLLSFAFYLLQSKNYSRQKQRRQLVHM